jgi:hypothetical protein
MKFTIRDLLWLTAFVAVGLVWRNDRDHFQRERDEMAQLSAALTAEKEAAIESAKRQQHRVDAISKYAGREFLRREGDAWGEVSASEVLPNF